MVGFVVRGVVELGTFDAFEIPLRSYFWIMHFLHVHFSFPLPVDFSVFCFSLHTWPANSSSYC